VSASTRARRLAHMHAVRDRLQQHFDEPAAIARMKRVSAISFHFDVSLAAAFGRVRGEQVEAWTWGRP